jgi:hypothetical protein
VSLKSEDDDDDRYEGLEHEELRPEVSVMHEAIQDAVTGALQDAVQEVSRHALLDGKSCKSSAAE